ncbi:hypothetical protein BKA67DRAFT_541530 [Truncatella angustata]|uniref:Uncharacterized protein n=1 Tax=Truncatella angustata TaxID=152316 RepID=A0A9P8RGB9_9PEZI|nr:uncharacterized protein BKA67DRAFT_541530 [Truncatella angustata]KAH6645299.1 hypothetical protein BKA67DRAFT_541530 [Truncatella angustata]
MAHRWMNWQTQLLAEMAEKSSTICIPLDPFEREFDEWFAESSYQWRLWVDMVNILEPGIKQKHSEIIRFAGAAQQTLTDSHKEAFPKSPNLTVINSTITALGLITGIAVEVGTDYNSLTRSFRTDQEWRHSWSKHYSRAAQLQSFRALTEQYMTLITEYNDDDWATICVIEEVKCSGRYYRFNAQRSADSAAAVRPNVLRSIWTALSGLTDSASSQTA